MFILITIIDEVNVHPQVKHATNLVICTSHQSTNLPNSFQHMPQHQAIVPITSILCFDNLEPYQTDDPRVGGETLMKH